MKSAFSPEAKIYHQDKAVCAQHCQMRGAWRWRAGGSSHHNNKHKWHCLELASAFPVWGPGGGRATRYLLPWDKQNSIDVLSLLWFPFPCHWDSISIFCT